jgi:DNA gyrase subunit A
MASADVISGGNIEPRALEDEMRTAYLDYAMSVIVGRALPDVRDGLKPVHRRVLYAMSELGLGPTRPRAKSSKIVGDVMGNYHPHGDAAIYDALVRMAQDFSLRYQLIDPQGNFGSVDDDPPAASRYTEARLARIATEMLRDLDMSTVDFAPNYDGSRQEPLVLPSRFPNLLVNGSSGIAVGMATNIPPHNLREAIAAAIAYIEDPDIDTAGLMNHLKGPDFPTGGIILGKAGIKEAYETGRGRVRVQARAHIEPLSHGKEAIVVTELPFMVKKGGPGGLIEKIAELVKDGRIAEIANIEDHSDKRGMRLIIELKRDAIPKVVLNKLHKHTPMQSTFGVNMVALVDNVPRTLPLQAVIHNYVAHQREVVVRRTKHELAEKEARAHILEGLLIALDNLDAIIELIRASRDREAAREQLVERFELTVIQATAILDLRLSQLTALESDAIKQEHADVTERIAELRAILGDETRVLDVIKQELGDIAERFGDERRTEVSAAEDEIDVEDLIADQQMVITITQSGYVKSLPLATYRQQQRGGRGVTGMDMKDGDFIEHLFVCSSHDFLLFFSNRGKVYRSKVYELPEASRTAKGRALVNILPLRDGERIQAVVSTRDFSETKYLVFATRGGTVKKTELGAYNTPIKADGIIAINIRDDDELLAVRAVDPQDEVIMVSRAGLAVRFRESDVRAMGRDTTGVRGMGVGSSGEVIAMDVARDDMDLLVVTENGYGKRSRIDQYRKTNRGAKGVKTIGLTERKGGLAGALVVREHQELVFISVGGMVQRTTAGGISQQGRSATGVRVMNLKEEDLVSAVALVVDTGEENGSAAGGDAAVPLPGLADPRGEQHKPAAPAQSQPVAKPDAAKAAKASPRAGKPRKPAEAASAPTAAKPAKPSNKPRVREPAGRAGSAKASAPAKPAGKTKAAHPPSKLKPAKRAGETKPAKKAQPAKPAKRASGTKPATAAARRKRSR